MTSNRRKQYEEFAALLKSDPIAKIVREAGNHDTRIKMLEAAGYTVVPTALKVLKQIEVFSSDPVTGVWLEARGASADEVDALEQALFGYLNEQVIAKLA